MISKPRPQESGHPVHALGISAILKSSDRFRMLDELVRGKSWQLLEAGIFSPVDTAEYGAPALDALTLRHSPLIQRSRAIMEGKFDVFPSVDEIRQFCSEAEASVNRLLDWAEQQPDSWRPRRVGVVDEARRRGEHGEIFWPGPVDAYTDRKPKSFPCPKDMK